MNKALQKLVTSHLVVLLVILCSCGAEPGSSDYAYPIIGDCSIYRTSAHQVEISSQNAGLSVPPKLVEVGWDKRFIIAKQQELKDRGDFPGDKLQVPAEGKYHYWILDVTNSIRHGPLTEEEFLKKRKELSVPDAIQLKPPVYYKNKRK